MPDSKSNIRDSFPADFLWGAATAGHQIEGNNVNSDVWVVENVTPTIYTEPSRDALNSFELWREDLDIVKSLGLNSYRFSLEWSRIEPEPGLFSRAMMDHYKAIIDGCRSRNLVPVVTFNHYTTPKWFAARGGWTHKDAPELFARYCDKAARHLAAGMGYATTLNEPNLINVMRSGLNQDLLSSFLPHLKAMNTAAARALGSETFVAGNSISVDDVDGMMAQMIAGHKAARAAIKAARPDLPVGVSLAIPDDKPFQGYDVTRVRAARYGAWLEAAKDDDFVGVQNYERSFWGEHGEVKVEAEGDRNGGGKTIYADSLAEVVRYAHEKTGLPILVTEHGVHTDDDTVRARLIPAALSELARVMDDGVPVLGYMHWSLLDNFEWSFGYGPKFGLVAVDRETFVRSPKPSAFVYENIARSGRISSR